MTRSKLIPSLGSTIWSGPLRRPTRAWESVILPTADKEKLLKDVEHLVSEDEKAWYASKGTCLM